MADQWTNRLSDYLDDELSADDRRSIEAHLTECRDCADTLQVAAINTANAAMLAQYGEP